MMKLPHVIKTLTSETEFTLKEKGSTFLSISKPVGSEEEAKMFLKSTRKKYYDATHHCFSYKLVNNQFKYSDDGEPSGTAGIRIYNAQNHFELTNLITIVARNFGGIKLGVGLLGKTYFESAFQNLNSSAIIEKQLYQLAEIKYQFDQSKMVHHLISKYSVKIGQSTFESSPKIECFVPIDNSKNLAGEMNSFFHAGIHLNFKTKFEYLQKQDFANKF